MTKTKYWFFFQIIPKSTFKVGHYKCSTQYTVNLGNYIAFKGRPQYCCSPKWITPMPHIQGVLKLESKDGFWYSINPKIQTNVFSRAETWNEKGDLTLQMWTPQTSLHNNARSREACSCFDLHSVPCLLP